MVGQNVAIRLDEERRCIGPVHCRQSHTASGTIPKSTVSSDANSLRKVHYSQDFVDYLAAVGCRGNSTGVGWRTGFGIDASLDDVYPRVRKSGVHEEIDAPGGVGVPVIRVSANNDGPVTALQVR